jgi:hypothetical protein
MTIRTGQQPNCKGCEKANEPNSIDLLGGWSINHYGGEEGYLGWIALQPICHRMSFAELTDDELTALGPNIKSGTEALLGWNQEDPVERVYVTYFFEYTNDGWHLHLRLIPRFKSMCEASWAWEVWKANKLVSFPERYKRTSAGYRRDVDQLMGHLRSHLAVTT